MGRYLTLDTVLRDTTKVGHEMRIISCPQHSVSLHSVSNSLHWSVSLSNRK